jgi:hypothetical protein
MCNFQKTNHECIFSYIRINLLFNFLIIIFQLVGHIHVKVILYFNKKVHKLVTYST